MKNIIEIANQIGDEVEKVLANNDYKLFLQETTLLYSLAENFLKFIVATNECWIETCEKVDKTGEKEKITGKESDEEDVYVDFGKVRNRISHLNFSGTIDKAKNMELIDEDLFNTLTELRKKRNNFIHKLYLFEERNDSTVIREDLIEAKNVVSQLIPIFTKLIFDEIGFTDSDLPEIFQPL